MKIQGTFKMTTNNVLQSINCNVRDIDRPPSKRFKSDNNSNVETDNKFNRWSLSNRQNEIEALAEMGVGMLERDDIPESQTENDIYQPSSSKVEYELNDTNPEFINLPGESISSSNTSNDSEVCVPNKSIKKDERDERKLIVISSKNWNDFSLNRRTSMTNRDIKDWFTFLSDEIILMIFKWLPKLSLIKCSRVCKRWHSLTSDETLWTRLDCSLNVLSAGAIGHILSRQVLVLRMAESEILDPPILPPVKASLDDFETKLMYLDLSMTTISTAGLSILLSKCSRLKKLSLEACVVNDSVCRELAKNHHLEVLNMSSVEGICFEELHRLLKSLNNLKELNLAWTSLDTHSLEVLCIYIPSTITRLNLSGCRKTLHNKHVKKIVHRCPRLKELDLSDCTILTNEAITDIVQLNDLNFLALSRCYGIQCAGLMHLVKCKSLTYLDIHGGHIEQRDIDEVQKVLGNGVQLNKFLFSSIARPTVGVKRSSIWGLRVRD